MQPVAITQGRDWQVFPEKVTVDEHRHLLYFSSAEHSVLERHLYVTSLLPAPNSGNNSGHLLTVRGFSHSVGVAVLPAAMKQAAFLFDVFSSVRHPPRAVVSAVQWSSNTPTTNPLVELGLLSDAAPAVSSFTVPHFIQVPVFTETLKPGQEARSPTARTPAASAGIQCRSCQLVSFSHKQLHIWCCGHRSQADRFSERLHLFACWCFSGKSEAITDRSVCLRGPTCSARYEHFHGP